MLYELWQTPKGQLLIPTDNVSSIEAESKKLHTIFARNIAEAEHLRAEYTRKMIKQRGTTDCSVATVAMAADVPYETVLEKTPADVVEILLSKGCLDKHMSAMLNALGYENFVDYERRIFSCHYATTSFTRNMLWGRRAILTVMSKNVRDGQHNIYWDGRQLFDPSPLQVYYWHEVEPIEIIFFDESRLRNRKN